MKLLTGTRLLKSVAAKSVRGVGNYQETNCPIAKAYGVKAYNAWKDLSDKDRKILESKKWTRRIYENFLIWYDSRDHELELFRYFTR
jgi:hypothetical protein